MAINVTLNNKKTKSYDLTIATEATVFKRLVTVAISGDDTERLTSIKNQLRLIEPKSTVEQEQWDSILIKLPDIAPAPPVAVVLQPARLIQPQQNPVVLIAPIIAEDGEFSFQALYAHLMQDMTLYTGNIAHLTMYSA